MSIYKIFIFYDVYCCTYLILQPQPELVQFLPPFSQKKTENEHFKIRHNFFTFKWKHKSKLGKVNKRTLHETIYKRM